MAELVGIEGAAAPPEGAEPPASLELTLAARPASVSETRSAVRAFAMAHGIIGEPLDAVMLAVSEAVTNAVMHAFIDRDPGVVRTVARAVLDELLVCVADDGRGMQPRADSPGLGIGLSTIGQVTQSLDIREPPGGGTELRMTFTAPGVRGRVEAAAVVADQRMRLLVEVDRIAAGLGWPEEGVDALVSLLCPDLVDVCAVDVVDDGTPRRLAAAVAGEPELSAWLRERSQQAPAPGSPTYEALALLSTQVVDVDGRACADAAAGAEDLVRLQKLPARWWVTVPLLAAERAHGLLHLGVAEGRGRPSSSDIAFFELVAARATRGLANTQLIDDLRRTRRRLERILDALSEAVTVNDAGGETVYANRAAVRLLGATDTSELLGHQPGEIAGRFQITREDGSPVTATEFPGQQIVTGGPGPPLLTRSVHLPTGREYWLLTKASLLDDDGPLAVNIIEDVTDSQRSQRRQRFLADAGRLLIGIPEPDMPQRLAEMAVRTLSDWCTIDVLDDTGALRRAALAHRDPEKLDLAREIDRRWPLDPQPSRAIAAVLSGSGAMLVRDLSDDMLSGWARDGDHLRLLKQIGLRSVIIAPLRVGGRSMGTLSLISAESARAFDEDDREFASEVAERVAAALEVPRRIGHRADA